MKKLVKESLSKQIADIIEMGIKNGDYKIGDKLPPEPQLMELFGVGRNTVREAIQSLTSSGLLETKQGNGTFVVASERLQVDFFNAMDESGDHEVQEVREMLEKHIVVSAIMHRDEEDLEDIAHCLDLRTKDAESAHEATQADLNYHMAIAKATHNNFLWSIYRYIAEYFNHFIYQKIDQRLVDEAYMDQVHEDLFHAVKNKDVVFALDCVEKLHLK